MQQSSLQRPDLSMNLGVAWTCDLSIAALSLLTLLII